MPETSVTQEQSQHFDEIVRVVKEHSKFLVIGHIRPDGDCLGSGLGLVQALRQMGKAAQMYTAGPMVSAYNFLPGFDEVTLELPNQDEFDCILCVDTADAGRVFSGYEPPAHLCVIDHHISNTNFGSINWVDGTAAAAAEMIFRLVQALEVEITPEIATALFTGIATDTGSFRFGNTTETTLRIAAELVAHGANAAEIAETIWGSRSPSAVKLAALVLSTINYEFDGQLAWNEVTRQMLTSATAEDAEVEGLSGEMRAIEGVKISVLFFETPDSQCRIGFRSKGDVNVATLAGMLGGGGHRNASGATVNEPYLAARKRALQVIRTFLAEHLPQAEH